MVQTTDIILNGAGYMIEPGTHQSPGYRRTQDGMAEGLTQRTSITDFFGGGNRILQLERDTFGKSLSVGPALGGQGVAPWAKPLVNAAMPVPVGDLNPVGGTPVRYAIMQNQNYIFFAIGKSLYRRNYGTGGAGTTLVKSYPNDITDLTVINVTSLLIAFGTAADIVLRTIAGVESAYGTNEKATRIEAYCGYAIWSDARAGSNGSVIRMSKPTGVDFRVIDYEVIDITTVDGELMLITKQALYTFNGRVKEAMVPNPSYPTQPNTTIPGYVWSGEFTPFFQQGVHTERDDFRFVIGFGGRTVAWVSGQVMEWLPTGDRAGWKSTGLFGLQCYGACVSGGFLVVAMLGENYRMELWGWDGNGWWRFGDDAYNATGNWCNPIPIAGGTTEYDIVVFHHNTPNVTTYRLAHRSGGLTAHPSSAEWRSPLIDAGDRDKRKAWRKMGAVFASPEKLGPTSTDTVTVYLDYSTDNGDTFTQVATQSLTANTMPQINFDLEAALSGLVSRFLIIRVRWTSVVDYAPILVGAWVEHEALENPARRRKWNLRIHARDQEIDRDGVLLTRTGRQLIAELWSAWETDTTLTFRDIDYDDAPTQRNVRIVGISESVAQPADSNEWGDSLIILQLVEV